jgi:phosphatidylglycerophosphate synthase
MPAKAKEPYTYRSVERSVVCNALMDHLWRPALRWVPESVLPNTLTLVGHLCALLSFVIVIAVCFFPADGALVFVSLLLFVYLSLDNMDGAQARRTRRSSPIGELLDHWGDGINLGTSVLGFALLSGFPATLMFACLVLSALTFFATMWEQRHTGCLHLGLVGATEGVLGLCALYACMGLFGRPAIVNLQGPMGLSWMTWLGLMACAGMLVTLAFSIARVMAHLGDWWAMLASAVALVICQTGNPKASGFILLIAASMVPRFGGRQIIARLTGRNFDCSDWILAFILGALAVLSLAGGPRTFVLVGTGSVALVILLTTLLDGVVAFRMLQKSTVSAPATKNYIN